MDWITSLTKTLAYIETHLSDRISVNDIAKAVYVSPFYLQKGFQIVTGYSIAEYVRNRRLYEAALLVLSGDKIIDVAYRYGYETPESFTKAFSRFHGCTPMAIRKDPSMIRRFLPFQIQITVTGGETMNYTVEPSETFKLIGFERTFTQETAYRDIPLFWDEIFAKATGDTAVSRAIKDHGIGEFAACIDDTGKENTFRYLIGGLYRGGEIPDGMAVVEIPACNFAKFPCVGPIPDTLQYLNTAIFRTWLPNNPEYVMSDCFNLEWYSADGNSTDADYRSAIWIPVRKI